MKKLFEKYETLFCIALIVIYIVTNSYCIQSFGIASVNSVIINTVFSLFLIVLMLLLQRTKYYGLTGIKNAKAYLYFIPLVILASVNLWGGIDTTVPVTEVALHMLTMINVGFIEEVIFRGFLFKMMEKDNLKVAVLVNALTFGIGHIVNLLNGADLVPTILQICYATAVGYLFVVLFYKSKSIVPGIVTHMVVNATSILGVENAILTYVTPVVTVALAVSYAIYINKHVEAS